jgi:AcrR family transcriptional regulator
MPSMDQDTKRKRIELVLRLIERHPNGLTEQEIAEALNTGRRTVNNYLRELEIEGKLYKVGLLWSVLPYRRTRLRHLAIGRGSDDPLSGDTAPGEATRQAQ